MAIEISSKCSDDVTRESFCFGDVTLFSLRFDLELQNGQTLRSHNSAKSSYSYHCLTVLSTDRHWKRSQPQLHTIGSSLCWLNTLGDNRPLDNSPTENIEVGTRIVMQVGSRGYDVKPSPLTPFVQTLHIAQCAIYIFWWDRKIRDVKNHIIYVFICTERAPDE